MYKDAEKQYEYHKKYVQDHYRRFAVKVKKETDSDVIEYLEAVKASGESMNEYIISLIREDMRREK